MTMEHDDNSKPKEAKEDFAATTDEMKEMASKLSRRRIDVLQYFSNLPVNRQLSLIEDQGIDFAKFDEGVSKHRKSALVDEELAVEKMLTERSPNSVGEKAALLNTRYRASIERFAKHGLTPVMIATHLSEVERKNYPRRAKGWCFTPAMIGRFMKDNGIAIVKK
jgi:hypothetical protein